jgi:general secretion pathway protein J
MNRRPRQTRSNIAGFTLVEALVALVLMGMVMTALSTITSRWLKNWNHGFARAERGELVSIAVDRLIADLSAAEFVTANRKSKVPVFDGTSSRVTLLRSAFGPNSGPGLEVVRIEEISDRSATVLVRSKKPFTPTSIDLATPNSTNFIDPVVLLRAPLRVTFAYTGRDGTWRDVWQGMSLLPTKVRVTVYDAVSARTLSISTVSSVHVGLPAACVGARDKSNCFDQNQDSEPGNTPSQQPQEAPGPTPVQNAARSL